MNAAMPAAMLSYLSFQVLSGSEGDAVNNLLSLSPEGSKLPGSA